MSSYSRALSARPGPAATTSPDRGNGQVIEYSVVIPTIGRDSLVRLLDSIRASEGPAPAEIVVVDDRVDPRPMTGIDPAVRVLRTCGGRGPAAARNLGWQATACQWIAFLDDDVTVEPDWAARLHGDLAGVPDPAGASQGRIKVPLPRGRRPTDWERNVAGLARACWATADMAYRREVLEEVGGFDERFARAFREDSDLGLRVSAAGYLIVQGERGVVHPVRSAGPWVSVRLQAGNADDALMRALHGPEWRQRVHAEPGRTGKHVATAVALGSTAAAIATKRRRLAGLGLAAWAAGTAEFTWTRVAPGPKDARELIVMAATSIAIPPVAVGHAVRGRAKWGSSPSSARRASAAGRPGPALAFPYPSLRNRLRFGPVPKPVATDPSWQPKAVLFDRDGTLIVDVPYLGEPSQVALMPGARVAVARAREAGLATAVVSNQSGVGRGLIESSAMQAVNDKVDQLFGPFDAWAVCCHRPGDGCGCRKPQPGLVLEAARQLGVAPEQCAVIGDIGADGAAARAAGARAVLVPTEATRAGEINEARQVAPDILSAIDLVLGARC